MAYRAVCGSQQVKSRSDNDCELEVINATHTAHVRVALSTARRAIVVCVCVCVEQCVRHVTFICDDKNARVKSFRSNACSQSLAATLWGITSHHVECYGMGGTVLTSIRCTIYLSIYLLSSLSVYYT